MKRIRYMVGKIAATCGYSVQKSYRRPVVTLNMLFVAYAALAQSRTRVRVLQVGAFDGEHSDPIRKCIECFPDVTEAILIEPQPGPAATLQRRWEGCPGITVKRVAISDSEGKATLWVPGASDVGSPWASLDSGHGRRFSVRQKNMSGIEVPTATLRTVLDEHGWDDCDVLLIDAEGMDFTILRQAFAMGCRPAIVQMESAHLSRNERESSRELFKEHCYGFADLERDTLAVKPERLVEDPTVNAWGENGNQAHIRGV